MGLSSYGAGKLWCWQAMVLASYGANCIQRVQPHLVALLDVGERVDADAQLAVDHPLLRLAVGRARVVAAQVDPFEKANA
jgi:hypothetical protein